MSEPIKQEGAITLGLTRKSVEGTIIFACTKCQAPGVYSDHASIQAGWPACYDPSRKGYPVGNTCPQCGTQRKADFNKGELNSNIPLWLWRVITYSKLFAENTIRAKRKIFG